MKIKCIDGKVRKFEISKINDNTTILDEAKCLECGFEFGVHDTKILKPMFVNHICNKTVQ